MSKVTNPATELPEEPMKDIPDEQPAAPYDATQARIDRCKPIVRQIMESLVDGKLLLSDEAYIEQEIVRQLEMVFKNIVIDHTNMIFKLVKDSMAIALEQEANKHWGKKTTDVTFNDLEDKLQN